MNYYTSDTHFGHTNVLRKMGRAHFKFIEEHDEVLMGELNDTVGMGQLYHLGDFAWKRAMDYASQITAKAPIFVVGNHDSRQEIYKICGKSEDIINSKFENGETVVLCHFPMAIWHRSHYGAYHLYGHLHSRREEWFDSIMPERRSLDVGVDNAHRLLGKFRPFSETEVLEILKDRAGHDPVEFYRT